MERGQLNATTALAGPLGLGSAPRRGRCAVCPGGPAGTRPRQAGQPPLLPTAVGGHQDRPRGGQPVSAQTATRRGGAQAPHPSEGSAERRFGTRGRRCPVSRSDAQIVQLCGPLPAVRPSHEVVLGRALGAVIEGLDGGSCNVTRRTRPVREPGRRAQPTPFAYRPLTSPPESGNPDWTPQRTGGSRCRGT
jgi:hypothetical protein